jgi:PKD repeat protein
MARARIGNSNCDWVRRRGERGQALVEMAIILPVFLLLLLIAVDFGRLFYTYIEVSNASREGAAYGATAPDDTTGIRGRALQETNVQSQSGEGGLVVATGCADVSSIPIACSLAARGGGPNTKITVTVTETFTFLTPGIGVFFPSGVSLNSRATAIVLPSIAGIEDPDHTTCQPPTLATFTAVNTSGLTVFVNPSASQPDNGECAISGYNWDFGDDQIGVGSAVGLSHTYGAPGSYTITLVVTNQAGEARSLASIAVPFVPPTPEPTAPASAPPSGAPSSAPTPTPSPSPTPVVCQVPTASFTYSKNKKTYQFIDRSTTNNPVACPIMSWHWTFGDGGQSNAISPVYTYGNSNSHTVTLVVTNSAGASTPHSSTQ